MISPSERSTRYGVEIKPPTLHVECEKLDQVLVLLEGHTGAVRVFDRYSHQLVVDGTVQDAQKSLGELAGRCQAAKQHEGHGAAYDPTAEDARFSQEVSEKQSALSDEVQISGGLSIATAYYAGDLSTITRKRDKDGDERYIRSTFTRLRP